MNRPLVTPEKWAQVSGTDGYAFGAKTACDSCDFPLYPVLRRSLLEGLVTNEALAEREIGFDLSKKYHVEEIMWDGKERIQLSRFGVSAVNVAEAVTDLGDFAISPFIIENAPVTLDAPSGDYIITVPSNLVDNPAHIQIRYLPVDNGGTIEQTYQHGFPRRSGDNWLLSIGNKHPTMVNIQHCRYMAVEIDNADLVCSTTDDDDVVTLGEVYAVKIEDGSYLPYAKPPMALTSSKIYFFYAWSLIDPAFAEDDKIDLEAGEFYKLCPSVRFECSQQVEALPRVMRNFSFCEDEFPFDEEDNLIITQINDNILDIRVSCCHGITECCRRSPIKIVISYRTDPDLVGIDLGNLTKGIVYLTAAELPFGSCNCEPPKFGFVAVAQKSYAALKVNPITGSETFVLKYGDRYGQLVYAESIQKTHSKQRSIVL